MPDSKPTALLELAPSNPFMSQEDKEALERKKAALDQLLDTRGLAKYKIEILFGRGFSTLKPSVGIMSFWESGSKLHGGGDAILHLCPGKSLGRSDCDSIIPDASHGYGFLVCPRCQTVWNGEDVIGQLAFRMTVQKWAGVVLKFFRKLEMKADIYVKYHPDDIRDAAAQEQAKQYMGEKLLRVRSNRRPRIYPLKNIIKDTNAGAELESRFLAFLRS